ncbi:MAG: thioredoxin domain-containing protein [Gemmatimonadota bacterium]|nr:thioredoxin domain-containing protein [Gemmatimonadota bacterium]MDE2984705.1 thioredoxin domain-containing protein [Gemmatimonadota bacterium]
MKNKGSIVDMVTIVASVCVVVVAIALGWKILRDSPQVITNPDRNIAGWRSYAEDGHWMGAKDAPVVIIEFGDYECPACRAVAPHIDAVRAAFPQKVAVVYRHLPLEYHHLAYRAARAAECAAVQGKFEAFHTWLYGDAEWMANPRGRFASFAAQIGMPDIERFESCLDDLSPVASIERDIVAATEL